MKQPEIISEGTNFKAISIGQLDEIQAYLLIHPENKQKIEGKVFLKELTGATGTEISFQFLPPHAELPYFHLHRKNEEMYIFLKGMGEYQVDEDCFPVSEGSIVRISPDGKRGLRNVSDEPLIYLVIQSRVGSLEEYSSDDGERILHIPRWNR